MTAVMPVPAVDVVAARVDGSRSRRAGRLAGTAAERLRRTAPSQWYGGAANAYDATRSELAVHVADVQRCCDVMARALTEYADRVAPLSARMRAAAEDLDVADRLQALEWGSPRAAAMTEQAWADYRAAESAYLAAVQDTAHVFESVRAHAEQAKDGIGRHVEAGVHRFFRDAIVDPVIAAWMLTGAFFADRDAWKATWTGILPGLVDAAKHWDRTLDEETLGPERRAGEWGAVVGGGLAMVLPTRFAAKLKQLTPDERRRFARNMADPDAPRPRTQTADEMLLGVDLDASEHAELGHTVRRHVDVDDDYLQARLVHGTIFDEGLWGPRPPGGVASAWADRATAEEWITKALREHEGDFRDWVASGQRSLDLRIPAPPTVGRSMVERGQHFDVLEPDSVLVVLRRDGDELFLHTAYPDVAKERRKP